MKAVILAANPSRRLSPFIEKRAKPMLHIAGGLILENTLKALRQAGLREIMVVVNHEQASIREHFGSGDHLNLNLDYTVQESPKGIGNALWTCLDWLDEEPFCLVYGDVLSNGNPFIPMLDAFSESWQDLALVTLPTSSSDFGNVYLDSEMRISKLVEKPIGSQANYVFAGIFILHHNIFSRLENNRQSMNDAFQDLIQDSVMKACLWEEGWIDIIYPWHILEANQLMMKNWKESRIDQSVELKGRVQIEGPVVIEEGVIIESGSVLKGPCYIGRDCYIGNNVLLRSHTALGPKSIVGYGCELKNSVVFGSSDIGRLSFLGDSVLGENTQLGSGLTTVNHSPDYSPISCEIEGERVQTNLSKLGAFIGDGANLGARHTLSPGCIVPVNKNIPDNISL